MDTLPLDLLLDVAVFLDTQDLLNASIVSKVWRGYIITTPRLWQHPRFLLSLQEGSRTLSYTPPPAVLCRHLGGQPIRSLHLSATLDNSSKSRTVGSLPASELEQEMKKLKELLPTSNGHRGLHIVLDQMRKNDLKKIADAIREVFHVLNRLSIGTQPNFSDLISLYEQQHVWHHAKLLGSCEIYPTSFDSIGFDTQPAKPSSQVATFDPSDPSTAPNFAAVVAAPGFVPGSITSLIDLDEDDGHVRSLSLLIPDDLYNDWKECDVRHVCLRGYQDLDIYGGGWKLEKPDYNGRTGSVSETLETLKLVNLWKLACTDHPRRFAKLASIHLSFHPEHKTKWKAISNFLTSVLGPQIQNVHIEFPQQPEYAVRHDHIDATWRKKISHCCQLKELTLVNYIPSTLNSMFIGEAPGRTLEKLILANDVLPKDFFINFVPEKLPRLKTMDISGARLFGKKILQEMDIWAEKWSNAKVHLLLPFEAGSARGAGR